RHWRRHAETPRWTQRAERLLQSHQYPGNVRALAHIMERACLISTSPTLDIDILPRDWSASVPTPARWFDKYTADELTLARELMFDEVEDQFLSGLLERCEGNVSRAARHSGLNRTHLQKMLAKRRNRAARSPG